MLRAENKNKFRMMLLNLGTAICLFLTGCKDKSIDHYNLGTAHLKSGEYDQTISDCTKALEIDPKYINAYLNRGAAYEKKGQYDQAISDYTKIIEINPKHAAAYNNRGIACYHKEEYDKAWEDVYKAQSLGYQVHPGFLKALREASGREK